MADNNLFSDPEVHPLGQPRAVVTDQPENPEAHGSDSPDLQSLENSGGGSGFTLQDLENAEIQQAFHSQLAARGQISPFSPSFLNSRPKSLAEKLRVTSEEEEKILWHYASTFSIHQTAADLSISISKVRSVVYNPEFRDRIQANRESMQVGILQKIEEAQVVLLDAIQDPEKLKNASITQISEVFTEISGTQAALISSLQAAQGSSVANVDPARVFTGEELEYMMLLRRRLDIGERPDTTREAPDLDAPLEVLETSGMVLDHTPPQTDIDDPEDPGTEDEGPVFVFSAKDFEGG